jgi:hypothetical protein
MDTPKQPPQGVEFPPPTQPLTMHGGKYAFTPNDRVVGHYLSSTAEHALLLGRPDRDMTDHELALWIFHKEAPRMRGDAHDLQLAQLLGMDLDDYFRLPFCGAAHREAIERWALQPELTAEQAHIRALTEEIEALRAAVLPSQLVLAYASKRTTPLASEEERTTQRYVFTKAILAYRKAECAHEATFSNLLQYAASAADAASKAAHSGGDTVTLTANAAGHYAARRFLEGKKKDTERWLSGLVSTKEPRIEQQCEHGHWIPAD